MMMKAQKPSLMNVPLIIFTFSNRFGQRSLLALLPGIPGGSVLLLLGELLSVLLIVLKKRRITVRLTVADI
jgi:hypothetical protein